MEHNEKLIEIINELNNREQKNKAQAKNLNRKINTVENIVEELPDETNILKSYLSKFKQFKSHIEEEKKESFKVKTKNDNDFSNDLERYSKDDSRVFKNQAKNKEERVNLNRVKKYSNAKANLTKDSKMSPLRLDRYTSS